MKYFPYENYKLTTKLSPEVILHRLTESIEPKQTIRFPLFGSSVGKPYQGWVMPNKFEVTRVLGYRNSFNPAITGAFSADDFGTVIHIKMSMLPFVYAFIIFWLSVVGLAGIFVIGNQILSGQFQPSTLSVLGMFVFGYGLAWGGFKFESSKSKRFFEELFEATEVK